jgi:hypothetical protein
MNAKYVYGSDLLIAYLDLCGTKYVYDNFDLSQQIERITRVISKVLEGIDNTFGQRKTSLYVHMYADSVVIAEKERDSIENCSDKFVKLMLKLQYEIIIESQSLAHSVKTDTHVIEPPFMPILSRSLIKRGKYYGIITSELQNKMDDVFSNFSLVGGASIVEMDRDLKGLPMGTYIDNSILSELHIEKDRLIDVEGCQIKFVRPLKDFDSLRSIFSKDAKDIDTLCSQLIESTEDKATFKSKLIPWLDAVQGRSNFIARRTASDGS